MTEEEAAPRLEALGHPKRLALFRLLVRAGEALPFGTIQEETGIPASTLSHHMSALVRSGLVSQVREGRETLSRANFAAVETLVQFLTAECCQGLETIRKEDAA